MNETIVSKMPIENRILSALSANTYRQMLPKMKRIALIFAEDIYQPDEIIRDVYFPESGIISLLSAVEPDSMLEVGIVGSEGMIGLPAFLGAKTSNTRALVQGAGFALKMTTEDFLAECRRNDELPRLLQRFTHSLMTQIAQSAACNRFHPIEARLARWLLMTHDRMRSDEFQITQEFLSNMLGVRREAVNKSAMLFQQQKLISYSRGNLTILDRKALEEHACTCYRIIKDEYESFLN